MSQPAPQQIDLESIIYARAGKKARYIPRFLISYIKKVVHIDFINNFLSKGYEGVAFCENALKTLGVKVEVEGMENLPDDGRAYTFVSNHPLGAIDGVTLGMVLGRHYKGKIKYMLNDLLMNLQGLRPLGIPVNKMGGQARNLPALLDEAFASENHILIFPSGKCSRLIDGKIQDPAWGKTFVTKSIASGRDIVPLHFIGRNSDRFYNVDKWVRRLGIKLNIPMFLLPDEMYRSRGNTYRIVIGKPIPCSSLDSSRSATEWAQEIRRIVYEL